MRKHGIIKFAAVAAAVLMLAGCGSGAEQTASDNAGAVQKESLPAAQDKKEEAQPKEEAQEAPAAETPSMKDVYQTVADQVELPTMYFADDDFLMNYYGIDASLLSEYVFASPEDAARVDSVILMKLKDPAEAQTITDGLNGLLAQMEVEMDNYLPEAHELVTQAKVRQHGDVLELVISAEREKICGIIDKLLP